MARDDRSIPGMPSYRGREAADLAALRQKLSTLFSAYGYRPVELPILEPVHVFLDRSGEELRRHLYTLVDADGRELCLRPDLTIPTARLCLSGDTSASSVTRAYYYGPIFRIRPFEQGGARQSMQMGVDCFGARDIPSADAEILALAFQAAQSAGLSRVRIRLNDLELTRAAINSLPISERWKARLARGAMVSGFTGGGRRDADEATPEGAGFAAAVSENFLASMSLLGEERAQSVVEEIIRMQDHRRLGGRGPEEIAARFLARALENPSKAPTREIMEGLQNFLSTVGPPKETLERIRRFADEAGFEAGEILRRFEERITLLEEYGLSSQDLLIDLGLHRPFSYYSGMIFDVFIDNGAGGFSLGGGGRYDKLAGLLSSGGDVPAVGFALELDRVLELLSKEKMPGPRAAEGEIILTDAAGPGGCLGPRIARLLRDAGRRVALDLTQTNLEKVVSLGLENGAAFVVVVDDGKDRGSALVKDLRSGRDTRVPLDELRSFLSPEEED